MVSHPTIRKGVKESHTIVSLDFACRSYTVSINYIDNYNYTNFMCHYIKVKLKITPQENQGEYI